MRLLLHELVHVWQYYVGCVPNLWQMHQLKARRQSKEMEVFGRVQLFPQKGYDLLDLQHRTAGRDHAHYMPATWGFQFHGPAALYKRVLYNFIQIEIPGCRTQAARCGGNPVETAALDNGGNGS